MALGSENPERINLMVFGASMMKNQSKASDIRLFMNADNTIERLWKLAVRDEDRQHFLLTGKTDGVEHMRQLFVHGVKKGVEYVGLQMHGVGCMKCYLTPGSSGILVIVPFVGLTDFMARGDEQKADKNINGLAQAKKFMQAIREDEINALMEEVLVLVHHVQGGDLVSIPAGWLACEMCTSIASQGFQMCTLAAGGAQFGAEEALQKNS
eukprot:6463027-Amphidinium_carterae.1